MESRLSSPGALPSAGGARGRWHDMPREVRDSFGELRSSSTGLLLLLFTGGTDTSRFLQYPQISWIVGIPQSNITMKL